MTRLFVALELPAAATMKLAGIQPPPTKGVRLVQRHQMHVTLHFFGEGSVERVATALASVPVAVLQLNLAGVGQFCSDTGAVVLWAGVRRCPALLALHAEVATALAAEAFRPETRPYAPHVTLAKCAPEAPLSVATEFLARHTDFSLSNVPAEGFQLCSSDFAGNVPVYRVEHSFKPRPSRGGTS